MRFLRRAVMVASLGMSVVMILGTVALAQLPVAGTEIEREVTALVVMGPQSEFLSPEEFSSALSGEIVTENITVETIEFPPNEAEQNGMPGTISSLYSLRTNYGWRFQGPLRKVSEGSGADWLALYKPYVETGKTVTTNPHLEVGYIIGGPTIDILQGRRRGGYMRLGFDIDL